MSEVSISFTCDTNAALLLMFVYELLTNVDDIDTSVVLTMRNYKWLMSELDGLEQRIIEAEDG